MEAFKTSYWNFKWKDNVTDTYKHIKYIYLKETFLILKKRWNFFVNGTDKGTDTYNKHFWKTNFNWNFPNFENELKVVQKECTNIRMWVEERKNGKV